MVYPHASQLLREYYKATNWSVDNQYSALTVSSRNLLDFPVPPGLHLSLSHRPTPFFASSLSLSALVPSRPITYPPTPAPVLGPPPSALLAGQLTYVYSTAPLGLASTKRAADGNDRVRLEDVVQSFNVGALPVRPELRDEARPTWLRGERVDKQDFLLYGRMYAPLPRLDALYVHRLSPTLQTLVSLISVPSAASPASLAWQSNDDAAPAPSTSGTVARQSELEFKLQQDTGRWSTELSYAVGDGMWGATGLYNFGKAGSGREEDGVVKGLDVPEGERRERVVDEEEEMSTGLKGRWSVGGEMYFSAQERSAGASTGVKFSTLPESNLSPGGGGLSQPPTVITATLNPIMGQLSTAYSVATSSETALGSRFDFNLFSYDSELTFGGEWLQRRKKAAAFTESPLALQSNSPSLRPTPTVPSNLDPSSIRSRDASREGEVVGVLKFRASTNTDLSLLWEGRLGDFFVSLGVVGDLRLASRSGGRTSPIRSVGIGVQYWG